MIWKWLGLAGMVSISAFADVGDVVFCSDYIASTLKGPYSVDFVVTRKRDNADLVKVKTWADSRTRIETLLASRFPDLGRAFASFAGAVENRRDYTKPRLWREAKAREVALDDKTVLDTLTPNCYRARNGKPHIFKVLGRRTVRQGVIHEFDPEFYKDMESFKPRQLSFLLVGEWLREWTTDVAAARRLNRFLHSKELEALDASSGKTAFEKMGLSMRRLDHFPVCERTPVIRRYLERSENADCDRIEKLKLGPNHRMDLSESRIESLENGDFSGMPSVAAISLRANLLPVLPEDVFAGLRSVEEIDLAGNKLTSLQADTFRGLEKLRILDLSDNPIETLSPEVFAGLRLDRVDLRGTLLSAEAKQALKDRTVASIKRLLLD